MKKTLLQINVTVNSGSTGRIAEEIGQTAMTNGWKSYIAYGRNDRPSKSELIRIGTDLDVKLHGLQTRLFDRHGLGSKKATVELIKKIKEINPDIIHLHNIHGYYLNYKILFEYLKSTNIPVVWTLHDCWSFTGHCAHFVAYNCNKWETLCENCSHHMSYPQSLFADNSKNNFILKKACFCSIDNLHLVPVSNWLSNLLESSFFSNKEKIVIYNGIDTSIFKPKLVNRSDNRFLILGVTNMWSKSKGLDDFIQLSTLLNSLKYEIILVGLTSNQISKLPSNIEGIERTASIEDLVTYYSMADAFLNMTYADSFPTTNLEALACGTPIITYNTGGSPEAISEDTGFVVEQGDMNSVVKAIQIIEAKGKAFYSANCRRRAEENFDKDKQFEKYFELYKELLKDEKK